MKLTRKKALELSMLKWELIVKNNIKDTIDNPMLIEFDKFLCNCPLCEIYYTNDCKNCPLRPKMNAWIVGCNSINHPFYLWTRFRTKKKAQAVLDLINSKYNQLYGNK